MSVTYPHDRVSPHDVPAGTVGDQPYVPVYARTRGSTRSRKGGVRTWMILAPLGVVVLAGVSAALVMGERDAPPATPLAEPAATGPVFPTRPVTAEAAPVEAPAPAAVIEAVPEPVVRPAPAPARRAAPAPVRRAAPAPAPATREAPAEPTGPQPYTSSLNATPPAATATPAPAPAAPPVIVIQPAG